MSTKVTKYNFLDLFDLKCDDLKKNVTLSDLEYIFILYIENTDVPKDEILTKSMRFISEKLLPAFGVNKILSKLLEEFFTNLFDIFEIIIDSISRNHRTIEGSDIINILNIWQVIFDKIEEQNDLDIFDLNVFIEYGLKFLEKYFSLIKDLETQTVENLAESKISLKNVLDQSLHLHARILHTLDNNEEILRCQPDDDSLEIIQKFLMGLLRTTKILVAFNIIACTTTLKFLLKLSIINSPVFENQTEKNFKWLTETIKFLCGQIHFLLKQLYIEDSEEDENSSDAVKYLKIAAFFVQCMLKLTEHYDAQNIPGFHCIIPIFYEIYRLTTHLSPEILNLIEKLLTVNILKLIESVYRTEDFIGEYLKKSHDSIDNSGSCILGLEIMKRLAVTKDEYEFSVYFYGKFFETFFAKIPLCPDVFLLPDNYQNLEALMISLWFLYHQNADVMRSFEEILLNGVLQYDLSLARICLDIWTLLARGIDDENCYHYFKFWSSINETFPLNCYDPKIKHVEHLVRNFYECLPKQYKIKVWTQDVLQKDSRLLFTLGINSIIEESKRMAFKNSAQTKFIQKLESVIEKDDDSDLSKIYFDLLNLFKLFSSCQVNNERIPELMVNFMKIITYETDFEKHEYFINIVIKFLMKNFEIFDQNEKQTICNELEKIAQRSLNLPTKLFIYKFYKFLEQENFSFDCRKILNNKDELFGHLVDDGTVLEEDEDKFNLIKLLKNLQLNKIEDPLMWNCESILQESPASPDKIIEDNGNHHPLKKIKLTNDSNERFEPPVNNALVHCALENAKQISNYFKFNDISQLDLNNLKEIIKLYSEIVNNSTK